MTGQDVYFILLRQIEHDDRIESIRGIMRR